MTLFVFFTNFLLAVIVDGYAVVKRVIEGSESEHNFLWDIVIFAWTWLHLHIMGWPSRVELLECLEGLTADHEIISGEYLHKSNLCNLQKANTMLEFYIHWTPAMVHTDREPEHNGEDDTQASVVGLLEDNAGAPSELPEHLEDDAGAPSNGELPEHASLEKNKQEDIIHHLANIVTLFQEECQERQQLKDMILAVQPQPNLQNELNCIKAQLADIQKLLESKDMQIRIGEEQYTRLQQEDTVARAKVRELTKCTEEMKAQSL